MRLKRLKNGADGWKGIRLWAMSGNRESVTLLAEFDKKHSIYDRCEEWIGRLLELLKDAGDQPVYNEVKTGQKRCRSKAGGNPVQMYIQTAPPGNTGNFQLV